MITRLINILGRKNEKMKKTKSTILFIRTYDLENRGKKAEAVKVTRSYELLSATKCSTKLFIYKDPNKTHKYVLTDTRSGMSVICCNTIKEIESKLQEPGFLRRLQEARSTESYGRNVDAFKAEVQKHVLDGFNAVKQFYTEMVMNSVISALEAVTA